MSSATDALVLAAVHGVGPRGFAERIAQAGSARAALEACDADVVLHAEARAEQWLARATAAGLSWCARGDADYPSALLRLEDPPSIVWWAGDLSLAQQPGVAIVGTRRASPDGRQTAWLLAERAVRNRVSVVSGLAVGIDAAAHDGALRAGGHTIAVPGTGIDVPYPAAHAGLLAEVRAAGLVLAEAPPGTGPSVGAFPRRNRLIAALSRLVVVVEAGHRSGALNTVQHADTIGTLVAAVPGSIVSAQCAGSNGLLRDGAHVVASLDDLDVLLGLQHRAHTAPIDEVDIDPASSERVRTTSRHAPSAAAPRPAARATRRGEARASTAPAQVGDAARQLLGLVARAPSLVDDLVVRSGLDTPRALAAVSELELAGLVRLGLDGVLRTAPQARRA
ncbi:MAG: DNA-processing protein DprA [Gemmatimonadaceae bacterium]|nr:DNA-processing protein DprA [Gemmatimonadaceae bacterium]